MSSDSIKKRKIADEGSNNDDNGVDSDESSTAAMIAEMREHMMCMKNKMDGMQSEMDGMKSRLSRMDELEKKCQQQEEKFNILEERCDSLQRSVEILSKESTWEYSAPPIPTSHWTGLGFDEEYIEDMLELAIGIKRYTCELRSGKYHEISLGEETQEDNLNGGRIMQFDDLLLPHWKELANAIQLSPSNAFESKVFTLQNVQLTSSVTDVLIPAFKGKLHELFLENNEFVDIHKGAEFIVTCIQSNPQMKEFCLVNNQLETTVNASSVLDAVISHPSINCIRLENCLGGENINGYDALCSLLASNKTFSSMDLDRNNIHTGGRTALPDYIASNPPLKKLYFSGNKLNDNDAILIAKALKQNTNLQRVSLYDNDFTDIGKEALSKAIYDTTSLNSVYDCNHKCQIKMEDGSPVEGGLPSFCKNTYEKLSFKSISNPKWIRSRKIHYFLSLRHGEGSNVQHLNTEFEDDGEDSLKLAPKVLEAVYNHSNNESHDCRPPLSIMYEILRGWKMPELYGNR